ALGRLGTGQKLELALDPGEQRVNDVLHVPAHGREQLLRLEQLEIDEHAGHAATALVDHPATLLVLRTRDLAFPKQEVAQAVVRQVGGGEHRNAVFEKDGLVHVGAAQAQPASEPFAPYPVQELREIGVGQTAALRRWRGRGRERGRRRGRQRNPKHAGGGRNLGGWGRRRRWHRWRWLRSQRRAG